MAGDQANHQHDGKSHQVLNISDGEGKAGWNKDKIKNCHRQKGSQHPGAATVAHTDQHYRQQKDHDDVGQVDNREQQGGSHPGQRATGRGLGVGRPLLENAFTEAFPDNFDGLAFGIGTRHLKHIEIGRSLAKAVGKRAEPRAPRTRMIPSDENLREIVIAGIFDGDLFRIVTR